MDRDDELDEIRRRKMAEYQNMMQERAYEEEQKKAAAEEEARRQQILRQILSPEARERLSRLKLVRPDLVENVENQLIQLAGMGRINKVISDNELKSILLRLTENRHETRIERR
ncbi:DNA-binding protein [Picrophilus oshimae]|uniref:DNA-binding protein PTO0204 n=2 Tax=Picrophilus torridus (strain ATCC 700027 / DSM 9790 / JCM 10055 / NBRC 100828 / KAW 2/3) TaxID=1122961 RepID=Y204_PICTO|nr:DNA-binding protein [Picrophilus oshimae]Q6L2L3.1 RecName: Full=DNA-binding protein PTO0204 [Picrophilus oshimae DSM 9789]AAT42789.1 TFAR19 protein [Picrophilus oshimae DSM 9789]SMD31669.1 DNA-binding TFAR19-related protein [Picrophilus oshimae DSM 9789]